MSLLITTNETLSAIVSIIEEFPDSVQRKLLHQLKMKKALLAAKKADAAKRPKLVISDNDIAEMVHEYRLSKK